MAYINVCFCHLLMYNLLYDLYKLYLRPWWSLLVFPFKQYHGRGTQCWIYSSQGRTSNSYILQNVPEVAMAIQKPQVIKQKNKQTWIWHSIYVRMLPVGKKNRWLAPQSVSFHPPLNSENIKWDLVYDFAIIILYSEYDYIPQFSAYFKNKNQWHFLLLWSVIVKDILILMVSNCTLDQLSSKWSNEFITDKQNYKMYNCHDCHQFTEHITTK